jgi:proline iminopeptidase
VLDLPFGTELIRTLAEARTPLLTHVAQFLTFLGELEGYVLLVSLVYAAHDKRLAVQLAVLTLVSMSLNHVLKTLIAMPRPFIAEGTWREHWAVSPERAADLASEYSTPSGHAMSCGAFYTWLYAHSRRRWARAGCVALLLAIGLSRPYLGVHYLEDVLLGWPLGIGLALFALRYVAALDALWSRLSYARQILAAVAASMAVWVATLLVAGPQPHGQPSAFISYLGFLTGIAIATPLETAHVRFDPRSGPAWHKLARFALGVALVLGTLEALDVAFAAISADDSPLGALLRYVRYASAAVVGLYLAPLAFVRLGLGGRVEEASVSNPSTPRELPGWIADHVRRYRESNGADGHMWDSSIAGGKGLVPTLLLTTKGRKSGRTQTLPLIYGEAGGGYVIVASKGGAPAHPSWYLNLRDHPDVEVQVGPKKLRARARTASGSERAALWQQMAAIYPPYNDYQRRTQREIPVVVLEEARG